MSDILDFVRRGRFVADHLAAPEPSRAEGTNPMTVSMVERVARAIYERMGTVMGAEKPSDWDDLGPHHDRARAEWLEISRAAIESMRDPTDPMADAIHERAGTIDAYEAGIAAALNEQVS